MHQEIKSLGPKRKSFKELQDNSARAQTLSADVAGLSCACLDQHEGCTASSFDCKASKRRYTVTASASQATHFTAATTSCPQEPQQTSHTEYNTTQSPSTQTALQPISRQHSIQSPARWNDLSDDVLRRILSHLPSHTLRPCRLICSNWRQSIDRTLRSARPETLHFSTMPNLHSLDLSSCNASVDFNSEGSGLVLRSKINDADLGKLVHLQRLERLSLKGCANIKGHGLAFLRQLPRLHTLELTDCTGLNPTVFTKIVPFLSSIKTLTLFGCSTLGDNCIPSILKMQKLQRLALPPGVTDEGLVLLAAAAKLERVAVRNAHQVGSVGISALLAAPALSRVIVSRCPKVKGEELQGLPNLRVLSCAAILEGAPADVSLLHQ